MVARSFAPKSGRSTPASLAGFTTDSNIAPYGDMAASAPPETRNDVDPTLMMANHQLEEQDFVGSPDEEGDPVAPPYSPEKAGLGPALTEHRVDVDIRKKRVSLPWRIRHDSATASEISPREVESHKSSVKRRVPIEPLSYNTKQRTSKSPKNANDGRVP